MDEPRIHALIFNRTGALFVYDERYPGQSKDFTTGYSYNLKRIRDYNRSFVEGCVSKCTDEKLAAKAIGEYKSWLQTSEGIAHAERASNWREKRTSETIERHRQKFIALSLPIPDVTRGSTRRHRVTHCYSCKFSLNNAINPECSKCGWIICECGACGCQYDGRS